VALTYIVAIHDIADPERFWSAADPSAEFPPGITLHGTYPRADGSKAVCLWEADSVDSVQQLVDGIVGDYSENEFYEVDAGHAGTLGLPASAVARA
jgi:hypothetical protein